jgi:hypothetical protein
MQHDSTFQYYFKEYDVIWDAFYNKDFLDLHGQLNSIHVNFFTLLDIRGKVTRQMALKGQYRRLKKPCSSITSKESEETHFDSSCMDSSLLMYISRFNYNL